jgi:hypothetical protein
MSGPEACATDPWNFTASYLAGLVEESRPLARRGIRSKASWTRLLRDGRNEIHSAPPCPS